MNKIMSAVQWYEENRGKFQWLDNVTRYMQAYADYVMKESGNDTKEMLYERPFIHLPIIEHWPAKGDK